MNSTLNNDAMTSTSPTAFRPAAPLENLRRRATLCRLLRAYFDSRGFIEVATPTLSRDVIVDRFVEAIEVVVPRCWQEPDDHASQRFPDPETARDKASTFYLQTSPEFAMKRLVAAGMTAIYQLAPAFRRGDRGERHNVEFTMLEWYRAGDGYRDGRALLADLVENVARDFYAKTDVEAPPWSHHRTVERPFADVFGDATGLDPHVCTIAELRRFADNRAIPYPESYAQPDSPATRDDWLDLIFSEAVQPNLGFDAPVTLYDYPATQSQLAQTSFVDEREVARRFELFISGLELANGYDELLDPKILRDRIAVVSEERACDGSPALPRESRLLAAMDASLPPCSGCALGVDRLLCALLGTTQIDDVIAFPIEFA
ncbi:MAG: EF-P lysine aminoacylase GenX [Thermoguttaceae bacterium]